MPLMTRVPVVGMGVTRVEVELVRVALEDAGMY